MHRQVPTQIRDDAAETKCASAKVLKRAPHPSLMRVISRKGKHPGRAHRIKRWHRYQEGMSLVHCRETAGLDHLDVLYYERHGLITLRPMTAEERREVLRHWDGHHSTRRDTAVDSSEAAEPAPRMRHEVNAMAHTSAREENHDNVYVAAVDHGGSEGGNSASISSGTQRCDRTHTPGELSGEFDGTHPRDPS